MTRTHPSWLCSRSGNHLCIEICIHVTGIIDATAEPLLRSRVLLAWLVLHVPLLFLGQRWKNLQVTVLVPRGVCSSDLCLTGVKNSYFVLVTSSEITDTVHIKHTFKVSIFSGLSRKGIITPCSERNSLPCSWSRQDMQFWHTHTHPSLAPCRKLLYHAENFSATSGTPLRISSPRCSRGSVLCRSPSAQAGHKANAPG